MIRRWPGLRRALRGDLDTILGKALKKGPAGRYASVAMLAADLRSYLRHKPVGARPDTLAHRAGKSVRRNRRNRDARGHGGARCRG
jgi:serine/threonine-protein kinase